MKIRNKGEEPYQALDKHQDPPRLVSIPPGEEREVSDEHGERMLKAWPKAFEDASKPARGKAAEQKEAQS